MAIKINTINRLRAIITLGLKSRSARWVFWANEGFLITSKDRRMPSHIGLAKLIKVQMAAIPMVPAPIKRTCSFQIFIA